jgi:hypothetical protein
MPPPRRIVWPGQAQIMALPPEDIMPQDGHNAQDGERAAGPRWLTKHAAQVMLHDVTLLSDDLYSSMDFMIREMRSTIVTCMRPFPAVRPYKAD